MNFLISGNMKFLVFRRDLCSQINKQLYVLKEISWMQNKMYVGMNLNIGDMVNQSIR